VVEPVHVGRAALVSLAVDALLVALVPERHHPALAGRHLLVGVEREHGGVPAGTDGNTV
jgi:hypothetical protein